LPLRIGTLELACYILTDRQAVFAKNGFQKALGYDGKSEDWLLDLLSSINKFYPVSGDLFEAYENPILFENAHPDGSISIVSGILPETLLATCSTVVNAKKDGYLNVNQLKYAKTATNIYSYFLENDIQQAVAEATGLNFAKDTGKSYLQHYLQQNNSDLIYLWIPALRDAFWEKIFEIHDLDWYDLRQKPKNIVNILQEVVFSRLNEPLAHLLRTQKPKRIYRRKGFKAQDNEHPELSLFITELLSLLKAAADNWTIFLQLLNRIYPKNNVPELKLPELATTSETSGLLDENLKKAVAIHRIYHKKK
jgi:hypothetical protein